MVFPQKDATLTMMRTWSLYLDSSTMFPSMSLALNAYTLGAFLALVTDGSIRTGAGAAAITDEEKPLFKMP